MRWIRMLGWRYLAGKARLFERMESAGFGMGSSGAGNRAKSRENFGIVNAGPGMAGERRGGFLRGTGRPLRAVRSFLRSEAGLGTLEIVLIAAVIIIIVVLFRGWITDFLKDLFSKVEHESDKVFS